MEQGLVKLHSGVMNSPPLPAAGISVPRLKEPDAEVFAASDPNTESAYCAWRKPKSPAARQTPSPRMCGWFRGGLQAASASAPDRAFHSTRSSAILCPRSVVVRPVNCPHRCPLALPSALR